MNSIAVVGVFRGKFGAFYISMLMSEQYNVEFIGSLKVLGIQSIDQLLKYSITNGSISTLSQNMFILSYQIQICYVDISIIQLHQSTEMSACMQCIRNNSSMITRRQCLFCSEYCSKSNSMQYYSIAFTLNTYYSYIMIMTMMNGVNFFPPCTQNLGEHPV